MLGVLCPTRGGLPRLCTSFTPVLNACRRIFTASQHGGARQASLRPRCNSREEVTSLISADKYLRCLESVSSPGQRNVTASGRRFPNCGATTRRYSTGSTSADADGETVCHEREAKARLEGDTVRVTWNDGVEYTLYVGTLYR